MKNIKHIRETYIRTESGKGWSMAKKNIDRVVKMVDLDFYKGFTSDENIAFFNNRVVRTYETIGYVPTKLTGISPCGQEKVIDTFIFKDWISTWQNKIIMVELKYKKKGWFKMIFTKLEKIQTTIYEHGNISKSMTSNWKDTYDNLTKHGFFTEYNGNNVTENEYESFLMNKGTFLEEIDYKNDVIINTIVIKGREIQIQIESVHSEL